jgi:protein SCO1
MHKINTLLVVGIATGLAWGAAGTPAFAQDDPHAHHKMAMAAPPTPSPARVMETQPQIADVSLVDQDGKTVSLREAVAGDEPVMVNFIFTSCTTICPVMSAGFAQLDARLAARHQRVRLVSISIDPEVDTPAKLREYAAGLNAGPDWRFLTGTPGASEAAQRAFGAFRGAKESHSASTFIRRTANGPWEKIDGLSSADTLQRAYTGGEMGTDDVQR